MGGSEGGNQREEIIQYILISKKRNSFKGGDLLERPMEYGVYTMAASHWRLRI